MRRRWAVGLILISILTMACGGAASVDEYKAAFVYVGPADDGGWSQAHDVGRQYLVEETGIQTEYTALVPEDATEFRTVAEAYIEQGYNIIFGTTFGYIDAMAEMAEEYPDVIFLHCSGYLNNDTNFANYFGKMYQPRYLSGLAAGAMTDSNKIGYVAAFPIPEVIRGINAFAAGVNEVNPDATVEVVWTFTWFGPEAETQAANALLETGADVLAQHQDSTATGLAAEAAGAKWISYNTAYGKDSAPEAFVTAPVWDWGPYYVDIVESIIDGTFSTESYWGGMETGLVSLYDLSSDVPSDIATLIGEKTDAIIDGTLDVEIVEEEFISNVIGTVNP